MHTKVSKEKKFVFKSIFTYPMGADLAARGLERRSVIGEEEERRSEEVM